MQTQLTLKLTPQLDDLNKAISKVKKSLEIDLTKSITNAINNTASSITKNIGFKDLFSKDLNALNKKLREDSSLALEFGMQKHMSKLKNGFS